MIRIYDEATGKVYGTISEELPAGGLPGTLKTSEMEALAGEMGASTEIDAAVYDDTALMLVLLLGRAPVSDEEVEEEAAAGQPAAQSGSPTPPLPGAETSEAGAETEEAPGSDVAGVA